MKNIFAALLMLVPILYLATLVLGIPYAAFTDFIVTKDVVEKVLSLLPLVFVCGFLGAELTDSTVDDYDL